MSDKEKEFRDKLGDGTFKGDIIGEFKNKHGRSFVLYRFWGVVRDYVTGDDLDWELGWSWNGSYELRQEFILSSEEADRLTNISDLQRSRSHKHK